MQNEGPPKLCLRSVSKHHRTAAGGVDALQNIDITIEAGEFIAITGVSGSGKSTLLNILGCLGSPSSGSYEIDDQEYSHATNDERADLRQSTFGFIFQDFNLINNLTVEQNVLLPTLYSHLNHLARTERVRSLLAYLGLGERASHFPTQLSGGQQQRVAIARSLINGAQVVLADEPTASLDAGTSGDVMEEFRRLHASGCTVVLSTHDASVAAYASRVVTLKDGVIVNDVRQPIRLLAKQAAVETIRGESASFLQRLRDAATISLNQFRTKLLRTFLTIIGIVIGSSSLIAMTSVGEGQKEVILSRIREVGTDLLFVIPLPIASRDKEVGGVYLEDEDVEQIRSIAGISSVVGEISNLIVYRYTNADRQLKTTATLPEYFKMKRWRFSHGGAFSNDDVRFYQPVVVFGHSAAQSLFGDARGAVGEYVVANNVLLQVVGVLEKKGPDVDSSVFVPLSTGRTRLMGRQDLSIINILVERAETLPMIQRQVEQTLLARRRVKDFNIHNMAEIIRTASATKNSLTWLLASVASLSLLVGGIGIMNVMLISVLERTKEIGIRIACGARPLDIQYLFLFEALTISLIGGVLGCALGLALSALLSAFDIPILIVTYSCFGAVLFSVILGGVFGFLPARRAASVDPVQALAR